MDRYRMMPTYRFYDVEGTPSLTLDRSVGKPLRDYKIYGNSVQDGTPTPDNPVEVQSVGVKSKNLFNEELLVKYSSGAIEKTESGYLVHKYPFNFTSALATEKLFVDYIKSILKPNVTYTLSRKTANYTNGSDGSIQIRGNNNTEGFVYVPLGLGVKSATFTLTQEQIDSISNVYIYGRADNPVIFEYIQLEEGDTATEYEPYGYKIPIKVGGKNLLDMSKVINGYLNQTGAIITPNQEYRVTDFIDVSNMSSITINAAKSYAFYDENKTFISGEVKSMTMFRNYTIPENAKYICFDWEAKYVNDIVYAFAGSYTEDTFPPYEPYKEPIKTDIYLDEPLYKIGKYADYIDFKNGKVIRKNKKIALQMNNDMVVYRDSGSVVTYRTNSSISIYLNNYNKSDYYNIPNMCNKFKFMNGANLSYATDEEGEWLACAYGSVYVTIRKDRLSEVTNSSITEYVNNLNAELIYALDVPLEQPIDLPPILTHKGTNVISVGTEIPPSNMQIQYYK